jgi:hypothetical protein
MTTKFFSPLSIVAVFGTGIRDPGSGMGKNHDPGSSRIRKTGSSNLLLQFRDKRICVFSNVYITKSLKDIFNHGVGD